MSSFTNYLNVNCLNAEEVVKLYTISSTYGEKILSPSLKWEEVNKTLPERVAKIKEKGGRLLLGQEGWDQLGVDLFLEWEGVKVAVDITVGSSTVIKNKKKKIGELQPILKDYKLVVLTIRGELTPQLWEDFLLLVYDSDEIVIDYRI